MQRSFANKPRPDKPVLLTSFQNVMCVYLMLMYPYAYSYTDYVAGHVFSQRYAYVDE